MRTLIEINHDYLGELEKPGALADFLHSLKGTAPRPPYGIRVLDCRHHSDPEFIGRWRAVPAPRMARAERLDFLTNCVYRYAQTAHGDKGQCFELDLPSLPPQREGGGHE
jgi:hypothetical protein